MEQSFSKPRVLINNESLGFSIRLYKHRQYIGNALVSTIDFAGERMGYLDHVFIRQPEDMGKGYGRLLMAHWLVESQTRGCETASADFVNARALRTFRRTVNDCMPTRMFEGETEVENRQQIATYDAAERGLRIADEGSLGGYDSVTCDIDLRDPDVIAAAKRIIVA
jgi:hypothetical protein